ncbi:MAG: hypothetical protein R3F54_31660 [Alphaproteobacteria bacterium]
MDIKEEVRRRIADLTRFAYERGYRDGAQSALAEIENTATDDIVGQLAKLPSPLKAITGKKAVGTSAKKAARGRVAKSDKSKKTASKTIKAKSKPKTLVIQETLQSLLTKNGNARRDDVLAAAQAENPAITKFDLGNGLRVLVKQSKVRVSPDDSSVLLPV